MRKYGVKLLITPAKSKVQIFRDKVSGLIHSATGQTQEYLLRQLNPRLRGWANYYRNGVAKRTFDKLDYHVYRRIKRWINRRHPNKSQSWKFTQYFRAAGDGKTFSVRLKFKDGTSRVLKLYRLSSTTIQRHIKVRGLANPYDADYAAYFRKRRCFIGRIRWNGRPLSASAACAGVT